VVGRANNDRGSSASQLLSVGVEPRGTLDLEDEERRIAAPDHLGEWAHSDLCPDLPDVVLVLVDGQRCLIADLEAAIARVVLAAPGEFEVEDIAVEPEAGHNIRDLQPHVAHEHDSSLSLLGPPTKSAALVGKVDVLSTQSLRDCSLVERRVCERQRA